MKRQIIMKKALESFAEKGIIDTSVQEIAKRAGISKGAFYLSFKSKDELINEIIDQFMMEFISDSDRMVNEVENDELLRRFLRSGYKFRDKHRAFSNIYIKEQMDKMNETMFERLYYYDRLIHDIILKIVTKLYPYKSLKQKHELVYIIKSFMQLYQLFAFQMDEELDNEQFVEATIEKIEIIAEHGKLSFINDDMIHFLQTEYIEVTLEQLIEEMNATIPEIKDPMIGKSIILLQQHLTGEKLQDVIITGLLRNIEQDPQSKKISYLFKSYMKLN